MLHNADLHCHSTVSDGLLSAPELARRAKANGVTLWALTDHDEISGLAAARAAAGEVNLAMVNGVEISVSWIMGREEQTVHVVGLDFAAENQALRDGLAQVRSGRDERARQMAAELDQVGIHDAYAGALRYVSNPALISRAHFARYIVECGRAREVKNVFDHWLTPGKPGYVAHQWAKLADALKWIHGAGGVAVLAHPGRYRLSKRAQTELLAAFKELGGEGIEVISGSHSAEQTREFAQIARKHALLASSGSDFHGPKESWLDLGRAPPLPDGLTPVWSLFAAAR